LRQTSLCEHVQKAPAQIGLRLTIPKEGEQRNQLHTMPRRCSSMCRRAPDVLIYVTDAVTFYERGKVRIPSLTMFQYFKLMKFKIEFYIISEKFNRHKINNEQ